jgi:putative oxidoreductase
MSLGSWSRTTAPASVALIRLLVGCVFLSEGIQKFVFPAALGVDDSPGSASPMPTCLHP